MEKEMICRIASLEDVRTRWDYLINSHEDKEEWTTYSKYALRFNHNGSMIQYYGYIDDVCMCEATAVVSEIGFEGDIEDHAGLISNKCAYLSAFRTDKQYEGKGYFSQLFKFMINDLKSRGYEEVCLGVGPDNVRGIEIYFHLGFREYMKTTVEHTPVTEMNPNPVDDYTSFYKMKI